MRSINENASNVNTKFVPATLKDVRVGEENERDSKIVAEKYIKLLKPHSC